MANKQEELSIVQRQEKGGQRQSRQLKRNLRMTAFDRSLTEQAGALAEPDPHLEEMLNKLNRKAMDDMKTPANNTELDIHTENHKNDTRTFDQLRRVLNSNANILILDLEFYHTANGQQLVSEIAGRVYGTNDYFYYTVFDCDQMTPADQLDFLRKTNLTYDVARRFNLRRIMKRVRHFIAQRDIDYISSFDNEGDFRTLNSEAQRWKWPSEKCFWRHLGQIDLEKIIRDEVYSGQQSISLKKLIRLLNLQTEGERFHQAAHDVQYINMALQFYSHYLKAELVQPF